MYVQHENSLEKHVGSMIVWDLLVIRGIAIWNKLRPSGCIDIQTGTSYSTSIEDALIFTDSEVEDYP